MTFWQNILTTSAPISAHQTEVAHSNQRVNNKKPPNSTLRGVNMTQARVLTERELRKVLAHCAQQPHANRNRAMLLCTHLAGMRIGEVASLRVCDVLNGDGTVKDEVHLAAAQTKGNKGRTVYIAQRLQQEITQFLQLRYGIRNLAAVAQTDTTVALFPTQKNLSRGFTANTACQLMHSIYKASGVAGASSHSGRRTFITKLAHKGVGVHVLMHLAGHHSLSTTQKYISTSPTVMKAAVELV